jgi:hypothetical protein
MQNPCKTGVSPSPAGLARRALRLNYVRLYHVTSTRKMHMKNATKNFNQKTKTCPSNQSSKFLLGALATAAALPLAAPPPACAADAAASRVDALVNFDFSNEYLTPRGMIVHDKGLAFQPLFLGFVNVYKGGADSFVNDVTLVPGIWADFSSAGVSINPPFGSGPKDAFVEMDPIAGVSVGFAKNFKLEVTYTAFVMQILNIGTSQHLDTKLDFDDSSYLKAFALHPYVEYWRELANKATAADVPYIVDPLGKHPGPGPTSSGYFEVGFAPSYTFDKAGLKLELPCRVLMPQKQFYGEYYGGTSFIGLYEVGVKASLPMNFMPEGYGHWGFHVGFKYQGFEDKNLKGMQQFNAPGHAVSQSWAVYSGISTFF